MFTYRTVDVIADTPLHKKLSLLQSGNQYEKGKQDLFAVVIAFRYLLPGKDFLEFKRKLIKETSIVTKAAYQREPFFIPLTNVLVEK